jgi:hypothetical protein
VAGASIPSDQTGPIAPVATEEDYSLIPGFAEGTSQISPPAVTQHRDRWAIGGALVVCVAVLALIAVLVGTRLGHRGTASTRPALTPSGAVSPSASGPGSGSGSGSANRRHALAQATVIDGYLTRSRQVRHRIGTAISAISGCTDIQSAVTTLHHAARVRSRIVTSLVNTDASALRHGATAVDDLGRAMRASARADRRYAEWGRAVIGCRGHAPHTAEFAAAQRSDAAATAAKKHFADEWNPIAARYGLPQQNENTI